MKVAAGFILSVVSELDVRPERAAQLEKLPFQAAPHPRFATEALGASASLMGVLGDPKADVDAAVDRGDIDRVSFEDSNVEIPDRRHQTRQRSGQSVLISDVP